MEIAERILQYATVLIDDVKTRAEHRQEMADMFIRIHKERRDADFAESDVIALYNDISNTLSDLLLSNVTTKSIVDSVISEMPLSPKSMKFSDAVSAAMEYSKHGSFTIMGVDVRIEALSQLASQ